MFIFPFITFGFLLLAVYRCAATRLGLRGTFLFSSIIWSLWLVFTTEFLSAYQLLSRPYLGVLWITSCLLAFCFCLFLPRDAQASPETFAIRKKVFLAIQRLVLIDRVLLLLIVVILFLIALTALMAPPNNWDSLVYHMSRVSHWQQNQAIAHYPTNIKTQIYFAPFAEWVILHFQILLGADHLANLVQWFAMLCSVIAGTLIVRYWGGGATAQLFAAFLILTIPMGILQGSSTQNDYVLTLWVMTFVLFGLSWIRERSFLFAFAASSALGLAFLTKGVAYIWAVPFLFWFLISGIRKFRSGIILQALMGMVLIIGINFNHLHRNVELAGHPFGEEWIYKMTTNERMSPSLFVSNVVRNFALHLATASKPLNMAIEKSIYDLHNLLQVDIADPTTTLLGYPLHIDENIHEDISGNLCQLILILSSILIFVRRKEKDKFQLNYLWALIAAGILFNLLLKWQPSGSRLHLPLFVLFMPWVAMVMSTITVRRREIVIILISLVFLITAVPYVVRNSTRKLISSKGTVFTIPRFKQYFANEMTPMMPYQAAVEFVLEHQCQQIGVRLGDNTWEYPLWMLLGDQKPKVRIEQVDNTGANPANYPLGPFHPCVIIETGRTSPPDEILNIDGTVFTKQWEKPPVKIYLPQ